MFDRILVVCVGNICRSPLAEFVLQAAMPTRTVSSAGLAAVVGSDMETTARAVAEAHGLACPPHRARQLTAEMCREADLILVMESHHREAVTHISPQSRGKVFLLGNLVDGGMEIADPYRRSREVFERVHVQIVTAAGSWADKLNVKTI